MLETSGLNPETKNTARSAIASLQKNLNQEFPALIAQNYINQAGMMIINLPEFEITVAPMLTNELELAIDFSRKILDQQGFVRAFDMKGIGESLRPGSLEVFRYIKFLVEELLNIPDIQLYVNAMTPRQKEFYIRMMKKLGFEESRIKFSQY